MAWGSVVVSDALTLTSAFQDILDGAVLMEIQPTKATDIIHIDISVNFEATPADDAIWQILGSVDGTTYQPIPIMSGTILNTTDPNGVSILVEGYFSIKLQGKQDAAVDTTNAMTVSHKTFAT